MKELLPTFEAMMEKEEWMSVFLCCIATKCKWVSVLFPKVQYEIALSTI